MINQQRPAVKFLRSKVRQFTQLSAQTFPARKGLGTRDYPILGCSIEISRDIYPFVCLRMPKWVGGITFFYFKNFFFFKEVK